MRLWEISGQAKRLGSSLIVTMLLSQPALADVTAAEVWADWQTALSDMGYTINGSATQSGATLAVSDAVMSMALSNGAGEVTVTLGQITFAEKGDGSVDVTLAPQIPINVTSTPPSGGSMSMKIQLRQEMTAINVSGTPENMTTRYAGDRLEVAIVEFITDGTPNQIDTMNVVFAGLGGMTISKAGDLRQATQIANIKGLSYEIDFTDSKNENARIQMAGALSGLAFSGTSAWPKDTDVNNTVAMVANGFKADGGFFYSGGQSSYTFSDPRNGSVSGNSSSKSGALSVKIGPSGFAYAGEAAGIAAQAQMESLPFPISFGIEAAGFDVQVPIVKSDTPQDIALGVSLRDVTVSDMIWGMIDPTGQLPRDPATIAIHLSGKATVLADLANPEAFAESQAAPGALNEVNIDQLEVKIAGANLSGDGGFPLDNQDLESFGGMPKPVGLANLKLTGGNGLLDALVSIGVLPMEQAMGARMMMALFTTPGDGADTVTSQIEFKQDGQILANGQRLK